VFNYELQICMSLYCGTESGLTIYVLCVCACVVLCKSFQAGLACRTCKGVLNYEVTVQSAQLALAPSHNLLCHLSVSWY